MSYNEFGKIVDFIHFLIKNTFSEKNNLNFVDCTAGNGYDTLFLCQMAGKNGNVISFDIQNKAVERTKKLLLENLPYINYKIINDSHENIENYISNKIDCAIFNLGYLPYSDKSLKTEPDTTIKAINKLIPYLKKEGKIFIATYIKHDNGHEKKEIFEYLSTLNNKEFNIINMKILNKNNYPPEIFIIEKNA